MKVYLLEDTDPEDRKVRRFNLYRTADRARKASGMAKAAGNTLQAKLLHLKSVRAQAAGTRDTQTYRLASKLYKSAKAGKQSDGDSGKRPGYDPETRNLRVAALRKGAEMYSRATDNNIKFDGNPKAASSKRFKAARASQVARAYSGRDPKFTSLYKNVHGEEVRKLARGPRPPIRKPLATRIKPGLAAGYKIDPAKRKARIMGLINKGTKYALASNAGMQGRFDAASRLGGDKPVRSMTGTTATAFDHGLNAQRAHMIAAKFLSAPGNRDKYKASIGYLRKGLALGGRVKNWKSLKNPLSRYGVKTEL